MKRRRSILPVLLFLSLGMLCAGGLTSAEAFVKNSDWSEEKIGKVAVKADKAAVRKKWPRAIKYGEEMLAGAEALYGPNALQTLNRLKTLNRYYDKAGRLIEVQGRIQKAYLLSKQHCPPEHDTAVISRLLYYKLLLREKNYSDAIPIVFENMAVLGDSEDDAFKRIHYLGQLHGLYGATGQLAERERTLLEQLELNKQLTSDHIEDNMKIILNLAKTYCLQKKFKDFRRLMQAHNLPHEC